MQNPGRDIRERSQMQKCHPWKVCRWLSVGHRGGLQLTLHCSLVWKDAGSVPPCPQKAHGTGLEGWRMYTGYLMFFTMLRTKADPQTSTVSLLLPPGHSEGKASREAQRITGGGSRALNQGHSFAKHQGPVYAQSIPWYPGNNRIKQCLFLRRLPGTSSCAQIACFGNIYFFWGVGIHIHKRGGSEEGTNISLFFSLLDLI